MRVLIDSDILDEEIVRIHNEYACFHRRRWLKKSD